MNHQSIRRAFPLLLCLGCVAGAQENRPAPAAVEGVKGVTGHNAEKGAKSFEVKGDFSPKELFTALQNTGLTGKAGN